MSKRKRQGPLTRVHHWVTLLAFALAAFLVYRVLRQYGVGEILDSVRTISAGRLALGALFAAASFLCLSGFDTLAVRYTGSDLPYRKIALASFASLAIGHTVGLAALSSGAVRYRLYTGWGLSPGDVARVILFCAMTVGLGMITAGGVACVVEPRLVARMFGVSPLVVLAAGGTLLLLDCVYLGLAAFVDRPIRIRHFKLPVPPLRLALGQIAVGTADYLMVAAILHQMLSATADADYFSVAASYVTANAVGVITHVPGGFGVLEAVILSLVPGANVIGALVAFRVIYYFVPFVLGWVVLGVLELRRRR